MLRRKIGALAGIVTILASCGGGGGSGSGNGNTSSAPPPTAVPTPPPPPPPTSTAGCSLTERQNWAQAQLDTYYLFPDTLPTNPNPAPYATVQDYIDYLTATARSQNKDRDFTYITSIMEENAYYSSGSSAGLGVRLGRTSDSRLFVTEAFEGAPALAAGLDRGTEILGIGTTTGNIRPVSDFVGNTDGLNAALAPNTLVLDISNASGRKTVTITKADYDLLPVSSRYGAKILDDNGKKVGYVNLRTFLSPADPALRSAFQMFKSQGVTEVVVDLRYNGGGLVSIAELFSNLLGGNRRTSDVLSYVTFRPSLASNNETNYFAPQPQSIAAMKIAFIGTRSTASASELVMNSFVPYLGVNNALIGTNTYGKPVGQIALDRPQCDDRLRAIAFRTENANRQGDYYNGLAQFMKTTCQAPDDISYQLGDPREASVRQALDFLGNRGTCTPISATLGSAGGTTTQGYQQRVSLNQSTPLMPSDPSTIERENPGVH